MEASLTPFFEQGHCSLPMSFELDSYIKTSIEGFQRFLSEPDSLKDEWTFDLSIDGEPDDGYVRKNGGKEDEKCFFHYRPHLPYLLGKRNVCTNDYVDFLEAQQRMYEYLLIAGHQFCRKIDSEQPSLDMRHRFLRAVRQHVLRLLIYDPAPNGRLIGKRHTDKSAITFHVMDSKPGLLLNGSTVPFECATHSLLAFAGDKMERLTHGRVRSTKHAIVSTNDTHASRWSVVFFMHI